MNSIQYENLFAQFIVAEKTIPVDLACNSSFQFTKYTFLLHILTFSKCIETIVQISSLSYL